MANVDRARKLLIRTALATSTTIATLVGAQNLAMLDTRQIEQLLTPTTDSLFLLSATSAPTAAPTLTLQPTPEIFHAAPSLTILRHPGETGPLQSTAIQRTAIQPPAPVELAAPEPVIVQGEAPPPIIIQQAPSSSSGSSSSSSRTRSSR